MKGQPILNVLNKPNTAWYNNIAKTNLTCFARLFNRVYALDGTSNKLLKTVFS